jgi:hypothetical protein
MLCLLNPGSTLSNAWRIRAPATGPGPSRCPPDDRTGTRPPQVGDHSEAMSRLCHEIGELGFQVSWVPWLRGWLSACFVTPGKGLAAIVRRRRHVVVLALDCAIPWHLKQQPKAPTARAPPRVTGSGAPGTSSGSLKGHFSAFSGTSRQSLVRRRWETRNPDATGRHPHETSPALVSIVTSAPVYLWQHLSIHFSAIPPTTET